MVVLVTGANGQLGRALQTIASNYPQIQFEFCDSKQLDITQPDSILQQFNRIKPKFCINAAAYTAVDLAESETAKAIEINTYGAANLAEICRDFQTVLLHISTDFVFDGRSTIPYKESDVPHPNSVYGKTKFKGELAIQAILPAHYIVRTAWVYSDFGRNFKNTMLRLAAERPQIQVVDDQIGSPTHAVELAHVLVQMILYSSDDKYGIYHYSGEGCCSWYEFAKAIFEVYDLKTLVAPIPTSAFPTPAKRPTYSVLDKSKIKREFAIDIPDWKSTLKQYAKK